MGRTNSGQRRGALRPEFVVAAPSMASWVIHAIYASGYAGIVALMFVENVFPPIPSEVIMPLAGYMTSQGKLNLIGVVLAGTAGSVLGAMPLYYLGQKIGSERIKRLADRRGRWLTVSRQDLERAESWFKKYGAGAVFFCRLVPGIRSLISIPAGIYRMERAKFLFYTTAGTAVWAALLASLGYVLGSNFSKIGEYLDPISWIVLGLIVVLYRARAVRYRGMQR